ncbi:MAG: helix-turn-helix domain-containing protein [Pirellulales bacterium]
MIDTVRRLLASGNYSRRQIAARLDISRGSVSAIERRYGPDPGDSARNRGAAERPSRLDDPSKSTSAARSPASKLVDDRAPHGDVDRADFDFVESLPDYQRCPTCGGRVLMPCLLCELEFKQECRRRRARLHRMLAAPQRRTTVAKQFTGGAFADSRDDDRARPPVRSPAPSRPAPGCSAREPD